MSFTSLVIHVIPACSLVLTWLVLAQHNLLVSRLAFGMIRWSRPVDNSDGIVQSWLGHVEFLDPTGNSLTVRRMPTFFETFPVILVDQAGEVQADLAFRQPGARKTCIWLGVSRASWLLLARRTQQAC